MGPGAGPPRWRRGSRRAAAESSRLSAWSPPAEAATATTSKAGGAGVWLFGRGFLVTAASGAASPGGSDGIWPLLSQCRGTSRTPSRRAGRLGSRLVDPTGGQAGQGVPHLLETQDRVHVVLRDRAGRHGRISRLPGSWTIVRPPRALIAMRPRTPSGSTARQEDAHDPTAVDLGCREEERVYGRAEAMLVGTAVQPDHAVLEDHVVIAGAEVDSAPARPARDPPATSSGSADPRSRIRRELALEHRGGR